MHARQKFHFMQEQSQQFECTFWVHYYSGNNDLTEVALKTVEMLVLERYQVELAGKLLKLGKDKRK